MPIYTGELGFLLVAGWFSLSSKHHIRQNVFPMRLPLTGRRRQRKAARGKPQQEPLPRFLQQLQTSVAPAAARSLNLPPAASARAQRNVRFPFPHWKRKDASDAFLLAVLSLYVRSLPNVFSALFPFLLAPTSASVLCERCISRKLN